MPSPFASFPRENAKRQAVRACMHVQALKRTTRKKPQSAGQLSLCKAAPHHRHTSLQPLPVQATTPQMP
jgi:hypothetical protein